MSRKKRQDSTPPEHLELLLAFLNTRAHEEKDETWSDPDTLARWLAEHGLLPASAKLDHGDLERALLARRTIRALVATTSGQALDERAAGELEELTARCVCRIHFGAEGEPRFAPGGEDLEGALGMILGQLARARLDDRWPRFKVCANPQCRHAFFDASNNRRGKWCDPQRCGGRLHSRNYRRRFEQRTGTKVRGGRIPGIRYIR